MSLQDWLLLPLLLPPLELLGEVPLPLEPDGAAMPPLAGAAGPPSLLPGVSDVASMGSKFSSGPEADLTCKAMAACARLSRGAVGLGK
jgi:hypothetical protein